MKSKEFSSLDLTHMAHCFNIWAKSKSPLIVSDCETEPNEGFDVFKSPNAMISVHSSTVTCSIV
jgi:hypothetical protein